MRMSFAIISNFCTSSSWGLTLPCLPRIFIKPYLLTCEAINLPTLLMADKHRDSDPVAEG